MFRRRSPESGPPTPRLSVDPTDRGWVEHSDRLLLGGRDLSALAAAHGSPVHIALADRLRSNATAGRPATSGASDVFSSYKTNPIPQVLELLHDAGIGAECISAFEVDLALRLGVPAERIVYNGPNKSFDSLVEAARRGFHLVNGNSLGDLATMSSAAVLAGRPMRSGIRIALDYMWGGQFGIHAPSDTLTEAVEFARADRHLELVGIHAHCGFPLVTADDFAAHVSAVLACCDEVRAATGWSPEIIDLGGSLVCATIGDHPADRVLTIREASVLAGRLISEHFRALGMEPPESLLEPGKALTADTQLTLTTVLDVRGSDSGEPPIVLVDVGVGLAEPLRGERHDIYNLTSPRGPQRTVTLAGPDGPIDDLLFAAQSIAEPHVGDVLAIMDTGAYFVPFSRAGRWLRAPIVLLGDDPTDDRVIRERETTEFIRRLDV